MLFINLILTFEVYIEEQYIFVQKITGINYA